MRECMQLARRAAPSVKAVRIDLEAVRADSVAAGRNRLPELSLIGGAMIAPHGYYDPVITNLGEYQVKLGAELPLFDGGSRRRQRTRAGLATLGASLIVEQSSRDAGLRAGELAGEILRLREIESRKRETLDWLGRLVVLVESGVRAGNRGRSDLLRVRLEYAAAQAALETEGVEREARTRELGQLLGMGADAAPQVRAPDPVDDLPPSPDDSIRVVAGAGNLPEIRLAQMIETQHRLDLDEARHKNALQVSLAADAGLAGADLTTAVPPGLQAAQPGATFLDRLKWDFGASVSVQLRLPLLDQTRVPATRSQEAGLLASTLRLTSEQDTQRRLGLDILAGWRASARRYAAAVVVAGQAEQNRLMQKTLYVSGAASLLEVLDAGTTLDEAQERLAEARFEQRLARMEAELRQ